MFGKFKSLGVIIGIAWIGFGIWLIFFPTETLATWPTEIRVLFLIVVLAYGTSRLVRAPHESKRKKWL